MSYVLSTLRFLVELLYSCMLYNKFLVSNRLPISWWLDMTAVGLTVPWPINISAYTVLPHSTFLTVWVILMQSHLLNGQCGRGSNTGAGQLRWEAACLASVKNWVHVPKTALKTQYREWWGTFITQCSESGEKGIPRKSCLCELDEWIKVGLIADALLPNNPAFSVTHSKGPLFLASESLWLGLAQLSVLNLTVKEQPLEDALLQHQGVATTAPLPGHIQHAVHSEAVNYSKSCDESCQWWVTWLIIWMKNPPITVRRKQRGRDSITNYRWASQAGDMWNIIKIFPAGCDHRHQYFPFKWHWDMALSCLPVINGIDKINESMFSGVMLWQVLAWYKRKIRTLKWVFLFCFSLMWDIRHWK